MSAGSSGALFLLIGIAFSIYGCSFDRCSKNDDKGGSLLVVARARDSIILDPARATDVDSADTLAQMFETLVAYGENGFEIEPSLAVSWRRSTDLKIWTFDLRRDVRFHDGTKMDADSVVYSFERQSRGGVRQSEFYYWNSYFGDIIKNVKKLDRYTVQFELKRPFAPFLASIAMFPVAIVSPHSCRNLGDRFAREPVGTGPYRFENWDRTEGQIRLKRFDDYWGTPAQIETIVFRAITDSRQRVMALQSGAVHVIRNVDPWAMRMVKLHPDLRVHITRGNNVGFLGLNTRKPPFNNPAVRWAVNRAVRKDVLVKYVYQGLAEPAFGPLPPVADWAYNDDVEKYPYDEDRARRELAAAGYRDDPAQRPKLYVMNTHRPYIPQPILAAQMIARDLEVIGMPVDVVIQPFDKHRQSITGGEHNLAIYGWVGDNNDPDNFFSTLLGSTSPLNISFWRHAEFSRRVQAARETQENNSRAEYYKEAQKIVADQAPWIPLAHTKMVVALKRSVHGFNLGPSSILRLKGVRIQ